MKSALLLLACAALLSQAPGQTPPKQFALIIGNDNYQFVPRLKTAVADARAVQDLLKQRFGFETTLLLNATRDQIVSALNVYRRTLAPDSSLLIYYAGHGYNDTRVDKAYWWPVDARPDDNTNWIGAEVITTNIKGTAARHVLIVSDSCYSGMLRGVTLNQDRAALTSDRARTLSRLSVRSSRELLASGGNEPVSDSGGGGHSVFAAALLRSLERMDQSQFAARELFDEVLTSVAGNSAQTPQFDRLRDSGDDGGSFLFTRASGARPVSDRTSTASSTPPPPPPAPAHKFLPENPVAPPPEPGYEPLTRTRSTLLVIRDNPKLFTDEAALQFATSQVAIEQSMWTFIGAALAADPSRPHFTYEWQKLIDQRPDFARGPLIDVFDKADADWSFLKSEKGWDQPSAIDDVFLFSRDQIMAEDGKPRDNAFTARRVVPVIRRHMEAAAAKAPTRLCFLVRLPQIDYDFDSSSLRFRKDQNTFLDYVDILVPQKDPSFEPAVPDGSNTFVAFPASAKSLANYMSSNALIPDPEPTVKPGFVFKSAGNMALWSPSGGWRDNFSRAGAMLPYNIQDIALDRQLRIRSIPMDAAKAEALHPIMSAQVRAEVFIDVDRGQSVPFVTARGSYPIAVLFARVAKVKIIDYLGEVMATLEPKNLPLPGAK